MKTIENTGLLLIERVLLLKSLSLFRDTPETVLAEIAQLMEQSEIAAGAKIVKEGDPGSCMYIIYRGEVNISKDGRQLATLKEKDFFGELSLLDTEARSATATATTDCILYYIDQEPFYDLIETRPEVIRGIIKILCSRLRAANQRIADITAS